MKHSRKALVFFVAIFCFIDAPGQSSCIGISREAFFKAFTSTEYLKQSAAIEAPLPGPNYLPKKTDLRAGRTTGYMRVDGSVGYADFVQMQKSEPMRIGSLEFTSTHYYDNVGRYLGTSSIFTNIAADLLRMNR